MYYVTKRTIGHLQLEVAHALLSRASEVPGLNLGPETGYFDSRLSSFYSVTQAKLGSYRFISNPFQLIIHESCYHSHSSSVGKAMGYRMDGRGTGVRFRARVIFFSSPQLPYRF
jgi:hypothetical protein